MREKRVPIKVIIGCAICNSEFVVNWFKFKSGTSKYCSFECQHKSYKGRIPHNKGKKGFYSHTNEHKEYMKKIMTGKKRNDEQRKNISIGRTGIKISVPSWRIGLTKETDERIAKCSKSLKESWKSNRKYYGMSGKKHKQNSIEKMKRTKRLNPRIWTDKERKNHSKIMTKIMKSEKLRVLIGEESKNRIITIAMREKCAKRWTPEVRKQKSIEMSGKNNFMYGKTHTKEARDKIKKKRALQIVPLKDTTIEVALQNDLKERGIKFEKHKPIMGQPDLFIEPNICIFADGDYWHKYPIGNPRDKIVNKELMSKGYKIFRYWEREINANAEGCMDEVEDYLCLTQNKGVYGAEL